MIYEARRAAGGGSLRELTQGEHPKLRQVTHLLAASIPLTGKQLPFGHRGSRPAFSGRVAVPKRAKAPAKHRHSCLASARRKDLYLVVLAIFLGGQNTEVFCFGNCALAFVKCEEYVRLENERRCHVKDIKCSGADNRAVAPRQDQCIFPNLCTDRL